MKLCSVIFVLLFVLGIPCFQRGYAEQNEPGTSITCSNEPIGYSSFQQDIAYLDLYFNAIMENGVLTKNTRYNDSEFFKFKYRCGIGFSDVSHKSTISTKPAFRLETMRKYYEDRINQIELFPQTNQHFIQKNLLDALLYDVTDQRQRKQEVPLSMQLGPIRTILSLFQNEIIQLFDFFGFNYNYNINETNNLTVAAHLAYIQTQIDRYFFFSSMQEHESKVGQKLLAFSVRPLKQLLGAFYKYLMMEISQEEFEETEIIQKLRSLSTKNHDISKAMHDILIKPLMELKFRLLSQMIQNISFDAITSLKKCMQIYFGNERISKALSTKDYATLAYDFSLLLNLVQRKSLVTRLCNRSTTKRVWKMRGASEAAYLQKTREFTAQQRMFWLIGMILIRSTMAPFTDDAVKHEQLVNPEVKIDYIVNHSKYLLVNYFKEHCEAIYEELFLPGESSSMVISLGGLIAPSLSLAAGNNAYRIIDVLLFELQKMTIVASSSCSFHGNKLHKELQKVVHFLEYLQAHIAVSYTAKATVFAARRARDSLAETISLDCFGSLSQIINQYDNNVEERKKIAEIQALLDDVNNVFQSSNMRMVYEKLETLEIALYMRINMKKKMIAVESYEKLYALYKAKERIFHLLQLLNGAEYANALQSHQMHRTKNGCQENANLIHTIDKVVDFDLIRRLLEEFDIDIKCSSYDSEEKQQGTIERKCTKKTNEKTLTDLDDIISQRKKQKT